MRGLAEERLGSHCAGLFPLNLRPGAASILGKFLGYREVNWLSIDCLMFEFEVEKEVIPNFVVLAFTTSSPI